MRTFIKLRDAGSAGNDGSGGTAPTAPSAPTSTPSTPTTPTAPSPVMVDVWGGREAPDWTKQVGLEKSHTDNDLAPSNPQSDAGETPTPTPTTPAVQPSAQPTPTPTPAPVADTPDFAKIAEVFANAMRTQQAQNPGQPVQQPSDAQIREQLGIYEANEADYEAAFGVKPSSPAQLQAYNRHLQNIAKQAVTVSQLLFQRQLDAARSEAQPMIQAVRAQEAQRQRSMFFDENKDLSGYEPLVAKEFAAVKASGQRFPTVDAARKFVADQVRATLQSVGITPTAQAGTSPTQSRTATPPQAASRKMTTTSVGGRSGGPAAPSGPKSTVEAVWGKKP